MPPKKRKATASGVVASFPPPKRPRRSVKQPSPVTATTASSSTGSAQGPSRKGLFSGYGSESEDDLSEVESDDERLVGKKAKGAVDADADHESDEDEEDWEDVLQDVAPVMLMPSDLAGAEGAKDLEFTLHRDPRASVGGERKKGASVEERRIRMLTHCVHLQFLLFHGGIRNSWIANPELQGIMLSLVPPGIMKEIERYQTRNVEKKFKPTKRGKKGKEKAVEPEKPSDPAVDPLLKLLGVLMHWWKKRFTITAPGLRKRGYKSQLQLDYERLGDDEKFKFTTGRRDKDGNEVFTEFEGQGEVIESFAEFKEAASKCTGSRDTGAMCFTALVRAIGVDARLVFSLMPLGFSFTDKENFSVPAESKAQKKETKPAKKPRTKKKTPISDGDSDSELGFSSDEEIVFPNKSKPTIDIDLPYPVFWTEVYSPSTKTWIAVDALVLSLVVTNPDYHKFTPKGKRATDTKQVTAYIVSYSSDGTARDTTVRYLPDNVFPGKTKGYRLPVHEIPLQLYDGTVIGTRVIDWWSNALSGYLRPASQRTPLDEAEDAELMPKDPPEKKKRNDDTIEAYKNHETFILERHLKREDAVLPGKAHFKTLTIGKGAKAKEEKVFKRCDVAVCKATENWWKEGRVVKEGEQPMKQVKRRAVTLNRKREMEDIKKGGGGDVMQGLYSLAQTELYKPPPIVDGEIPKNNYGNIDVYVRTMIPAGAVHIPLKGAHRVAKKLGISYAEAVTGFEFKKQRAVPFVEGVVVAAENEDVVRDAWVEEDRERRKKEDKKRQELCLGLWRRMLVKLRLRNRLREDYKHLEEWDRDPNRPNGWKSIDEVGPRITEGDYVPEEGGFLREDHEDGAGGFLPDDPDSAGGGFILEVEHAHDPPPESAPLDGQQPQSLSDMLANGSLRRLGYEQDEERMETRSRHFSQQSRSPLPDSDEDMEDPEVATPMTRKRTRGRKKAVHGEDDEVVKGGRRRKSGRGEKEGEVDEEETPRKTKSSRGGRKVR